MTRDRAALGEFLRARRDRLTPAQAGVEPFPGPRRVPGLRREELAVLAGLSPDYYSRLEQGRQANVSDQVLDALARALRLDAVEHDHLRAIAGPTSVARPTTQEPPQRADPGLLRLVAALDHLPVLLLGRRGEVLAHNHLLTAVLGVDLPVGASFPRVLLLDRDLRDRIRNWPVFGSAMVAGLRGELGRRPYDERLLRLVEDLRADPDVDRWWADHGVRDYGSVTKQIVHPVAGTIEFAIEVVQPPQEPDQHLVVYTAEPDSAAARALPLLASWVREPV